MITTNDEYVKACEELAQLEAWLQRLQSSPVFEKGLTRAGLRKMIARLHEELAVYEGSLETRKQPTS